MSNHGPVVEPSLELLAGFLERQGLPHGAKHLRQTAATITALRDRVTYLEALVEVFQRDNPPLSNAALQAEVERKDAALEQIKARAEKLRAGTDDWFELVEFALIAGAALERPKI